MGTGSETKANHNVNRTPDSESANTRANLSMSPNTEDGTSTRSNENNTGGELQKIESPETAGDPKLSPTDRRTMMSVISSHRGRLSAKMRRNYELRASKYSMNNQQHGALQSFKISPRAKTRRRRRRKKGAAGNTYSAADVQSSAERQRKLVDCLLEEQDRQRADKSTRVNAEGVDERNAEEINDGNANDGNLGNANDENLGNAKNMNDENLGSAKNMNSEEDIIERNKVQEMKEESVKDDRNTESIIEERNAENPYQPPIDEENVNAVNAEDDPKDTVFQAEADPENQNVTDVADDAGRRNKFSTVERGKFNGAILGHAEGIEEPPKNTHGGQGAIAGRVVDCEKNHESKISEDENVKHQESHRSTERDASAPLSEEPKFRKEEGAKKFEKKIRDEKNFHQHQQAGVAEVQPYASPVASAISPAANMPYPYRNEAADTTETIGSVAATVAAWGHAELARDQGPTAGVSLQVLTPEQEETLQGTNSGIVKMHGGSVGDLGKAPGNVSGNAAEIRAATLPKGSAAGRISGALGNAAGRISGAPGNAQAAISGAPGNTPSKIPGAPGNTPARIAGPRNAAAGMPGVMQELMGSVPPEAVLPGVPNIPAGYLPMLMSPQGFLVPLQYRPVSMRGDIIPLVRPVWTGGLLGYGGDDQDADRPTLEDEVAVVLTRMPTLFPTGKRAKPTRTKKSPLSRRDRLAATRVCIMSHESFERAHRRKTFADIGSGPGLLRQGSSVVRYLALENSLQAPAQAVHAYRDRKRHLERMLRALDGDLCDPESNTLLHGLERDTRERRDYDLVREDTFAKYLKEQILLHALDRGLELRAQIALDYTSRLLKLKKYLLRSRHAFTSCKDQLFYVNSSKSERLWRSFLEKQRARLASGVQSAGGVQGVRSMIQDAHGVQSAADSRYTRGRRRRRMYMAFPGGRNDEDSAGAGAGGADSSAVRDSGSESATSVSSRVAGAAATARTAGIGRMGSHVISKKSLLTDELMPIIGAEDFLELTKDKSKLYDSYIMHSPYPEVADQSDIVALIEFFKCKSTLGDLFDLLQPADHRKPGPRSGLKANAKNPEENDPYSRFYPTRDSSPAVSDGLFHRHTRTGGLNITSSLDASLSDEDRVRWLVLDEKQIRTKFTKAYKRLVGLSNEEIDHDIRILYPDVEKNAS